MTGTLPCILSEIFPTKVRYSGFAFTFNSANALFGGTAPLIATWLISVTGSKVVAPAWLLVAAAAVGLVAMIASRETAWSELKDEYAMASESRRHVLPDSRQCPP